VPDGKNKIPDPPPPEAWERARVLTPAACEREPGLISDGGGLPFTPAAAFSPASTLDPNDPAVSALLVQIERGRVLAQPTRLFRPKAKPPDMETSALLAGWRELARSEDEVVYGRGRPPQLLTVAVRRARRRRWEPLGASNSRPLRAVRDGVRASSWRLDPSFELSPDQSELRILVTEQTLASGTSVTERLQTPDLFIDELEVLLRVYVSPLQGYVGRAGRRETPVIVALPEPIAGRRVVDGALYAPPGV
jgi:hypothetical protein